MEFVLIYPFIGLFLFGWFKWDTRKTKLGIPGWIQAVIAILMMIVWLPALVWMAATDR